MNLVNFILICIIFNVQYIYTTINSPDYLINLAQMEIHIYNVLSEYSNNLKHTIPIPIIKEYLEDFVNSSLKVFKDKNRKEDFAIIISKNPIMSYRMIWRFVKILRPIGEYIKTHEDEVFIRQLTNGETWKQMQSIWPHIPDVQDAMEYILMIHHVYDIDLNMFTSGNIMGIKTDVGLTAKHCQEIGEFAIQKKYFSYGILWLEVAFSKTNKTTILSKDILKSLKIATETHDIAWNSKTSSDYYFFQNQLNETRKIENRRIFRKIAYDQNKRDYENNTHVRFWKLCSGGTYKTNKEIAELHCWYDTKSNPSWAINPLKIEQISKTPYLIQIHEFLNSKLISKIKTQMSPKMNSAPSTIFMRKTGGISRQSYVVGFSTDDDWTHSLSRRIESITGLNVVSHNAAEIFMTSMYTFGNHIDYHTDYADTYFDDTDNRVASVMFYLNDVEAGGYTAFPNMGTFARPLNGSVMIWYNMLRNGKEDPNSIHGACPVVIGHKWITTKWIRMNAQIFTRPCGLDPAE